MAVDFHETQRSLLSKLLNDGDVLSENRPSTQNGSPSFHSSGSSSSGLSSPFGSELGSTSTESDDDDDDSNDDFIDELTRQMADYMLEEDDEKLSSTEPTSVPEQTYQAFSDDQTRAVHVYKLENQPSTVRWPGRRVARTELTQQQKPHHMQNRGGRADAESGGGFGSPGATAAALPLQQRWQQFGSGSGMRAVFLGGPGSRNGSCGTGVFLPRGTGNATDVSRPSKKSGSTVLIPARVLQALQLHFEDMNIHSRSHSNAAVASTTHPLQHDVDGARKSDTYSQQKSRTRPAVVNHHQEIDLPQEWTY